MPFKVILGNITKQKVDAIVNPAIRKLQQGNGICTDIFIRAGYKKLAVACMKLAPIEKSEAVITPGFRLPAKYIIHVCCPNCRGMWEDEERLLHDSYINALKCAIENGCKTVAFPLLSSAYYAFPKQQAYDIALSSIQEFLAEHDIDVTLVLYDKEVRFQ